MGIFSKIKERFAGYMMPTYIITTSDGSNVMMSEDGAMRVSTVYSCVRIIAEDVGTLPIHVKQRKPNGERIWRTDHPVAKVLRRPNPYMSGVDFRRAMIASLELHGNAYAHISERDRMGYPIRIDLLDASQVTPIKGDTDVFYDVASIGQLVPSRDIIHLKGYAPDGITGKSPIRLHRETIENNLNATRFSKKLFKNDLRTAAVFSTPGTLKTESYERLRSQIKAMWRQIGSPNSDPLVLENDTKLSTLTITPEDAQFVATKLQNIDEIAAIYRVPPHKVGDWTRGTYSNNTQANLEYYTDCVRPLLVSTEEEFNLKLFLEKEQGEMYVDTEFKGLLRTAPSEQMEIYTKGFNIGVYSPNDIREMEDLPPYEGGERYYVPVNLASNDKKPSTND
jgi:HK97 family phage portal protein